MALTRGASFHSTEYSAKARPAKNAPMMAAMPILSAATESPRQRASARISGAFWVDMRSTPGRILWITLDAKNTMKTVNATASTQQHGELHPLHPGARGQAGHHRQHDHAQDVVGHRRCQDDARHPCVQHAQVSHDAGGDADAGGHHGRRHEDGFVGGVAAQQAQVGESQHERRQHARRG